MFHPGRYSVRKRWTIKCPYCKKIYKLKKFLTLLNINSARGKKPCPNCGLTIILS